MTSINNFKQYYLWYSKKYLERQPLYEKRKSSFDKTYKKIISYPTTKIYLGEDGIEYICTHVTLTEDSKPLFDDTILIAYTNCEWYKTGNKYYCGKVYC